MHGGDSTGQAQPAFGRQRRSCRLCGRREEVHALHLTDVWMDGTLARACEECQRRGPIWFCQRCGQAQAGQRLAVGPLSFCRSCAAEPGADLIAP